MRYSRAWRILPFFIWMKCILIFSKNPVEHEQHVRAVRARLREHQFYATLSKCEYFKDTLLFLGHILGPGGVRVNPDKIKSLMEWPPPRTVSENRQFVGLANVFRKFVANLSSMPAKPLTDLTNAGVIWEWGDSEQKAFADQI
jgi:hypothetical protein